MIWGVQSLESVGFLPQKYELFLLVKEKKII